VFQTGKLVFDLGSELELFDEKNGPELTAPASLKTNCGEACLAVNS
jgi:hypothetical protein